MFDRRKLDGPASLKKARKKNIQIRPPHLR
jgi:hypothetical protein